MKSKLLLSLLLIVPLALLGKIPADFSVMVIDLKYNPEDGVKICEMQHLYNSALDAEWMLFGGSGYAAEKLCAQLKSHLPEAWVYSKGMTSYFVPTFKRQHNWHVKPTLSQFKGNHAFPKSANHLPKEPSLISQYKGFFLGNYRHVDLHQFKRENPGFIVVNYAFYPLSRKELREDKAITSSLFRGSEELERLKPEWKVYKKIWNENELERLEEEIYADFEQEYLVIKPHGGAFGMGIIILKRGELREKLDYIFLNQEKSSNDPDKAYHYWAKDRDGSFIVEAFYPSIEVCAPHLGGHIYDPTMRVVMSFCYSGGNISIRCLESYWKLPKKGLDEEAPLTDQHKSFSGAKDHYLSVDPQTHADMERQLVAGLKHLYRSLLG